MTIWAVILITVALTLLVAIPTLGAVRFRPHRARSVRYAEASVSQVVEHVAVVRMAHPEIVKIERVDRHPFYLGAAVATVGYSVCVFFGAPLTSNVVALGLQTRYTMATCFLVGGLLMLIGAAMGGQLLGIQFMPDVKDHLTAAALGDDIVLPYRVACSGLLATGASMGIYASTSFRNTTGSLGGWLNAVLSLMCIVTIIWFYRRTQLFIRHDTTLISEAMTRYKLGGDYADQ